MTYQKAKAEKEWLEWKTQEEKQLRELGVDEDTIQRLHTYDWAQFNKERRYRLFFVDTPANCVNVPAQEEYPEPVTAGDLLDEIEDERLFAVLQETDKRTLEILLLKIKGFSSKEIGAKVGMNAFAVNNRIYRLKRKLKNIF